MLFLRSLRKVERIDSNQEINEIVNKSLTEGQACRTSNIAVHLKNEVGRQAAHMQTTLSVATFTRPLQRVACCGYIM
jgi:hypothetical protein